MVEDEIAIKWNTVKAAPEQVLALAETCPCTGNGLSCTDACTKTDCENYINEEINNEQNEEVEDEDEHYDYESEF